MHACPNITQEHLCRSPPGTLAASMAANSALTGTNVTEIADHPGVRECLQFFTREKQWINEVHVQLCRVPAPTFLEQERAAWFLEQFRSYGCDASIDRAGNVLAALGDPPYVALTAHLDTVLAPRSKEAVSYTHLFNSGPPLLPGLMAASVCRKWENGMEGSTSRSLALMMPAVTVA